MIILMLSGGIFSVLGTFFIHFFLYLSVNYSEANFWGRYPSIALSELVRLFVVGFLSVGFIALFLVPKLQHGYFNSKRWMIRGGFFGAVAGFMNFIFLYSSGIIRSFDDIKLVLQDLHLTSIFFGIPAALIGAMAGIVVAIILRRFANNEFWNNRE